MLQKVEKFLDGLLEDYAEFLFLSLSPSPLTLYFFFFLFFLFSSENAYLQWYVELNQNGAKKKYEIKQKLHVNNKNAGNFYFNSERKNKTREIIKSPGIHFLPLLQLNAKNLYVCR